MKDNTSKGDGMIFYDEATLMPDLKYLPDGKVKAKRWWSLKDRRSAKLLTKVLNSDTFKKGIFKSW